MLGKWKFWRLEKLSLGDKRHQTHRDPNNGGGMGVLACNHFRGRVRIPRNMFRGGLINGNKGNRNFKSGRSDISAILKEIKKKIPNFTRITFRYIPRTANGVTQALAREGRCHELPRYWIEEVRDSLEEAVKYDREGSERTVFILAKKKIGSEMGRSGFGSCGGDIAMFKHQGSNGKLECCWVQTMMCEAPSLAEGALRCSNIKSNTATTSTNSIGKHRDNGKEGVMGICKNAELSKNRHNMLTGYKLDQVKIDKLLILQEGNIEVVLESVTPDKA
ncbi:hypothetical protein Goari_002875 [Gossypium aridum]|uniref:RNase H type-1 domain-containing protein n=1 Tax=Gossypium aridum TaxID=34290 RepID=A0A7J8Y9P9_GOSAI|nr:hypothetical protein [Gossypium aridum]